MNMKNIIDQNYKELIKYILDNKKIINHYFREKIHLKKNGQWIIEHMNNIKNISSQLTTRILEKTKLGRLFTSMLLLSNDHSEIKIFALEILENLKTSIKNEIFCENEIRRNEFDILSMEMSPLYEKFDNYESLENLRKYIKFLRNDNKMEKSKIVEINDSNLNIKTVDENCYFSEDMVNTSIEYLHYIQSIENDYLMKKRKKITDFDLELEEKNENVNMDFKLTYSPLKTDRPQLIKKIEEEEKINNQINEINNKTQINKKLKKSAKIIEYHRKSKKKASGLPLNYKKSQNKNLIRNLEDSHTTLINEKKEKALVDNLIKSPIDTRSKMIHTNSGNTKEDDDEKSFDFNSKEFKKIRKMTIYKFKKLLKNLMPDEDEKNVKKIAEETEKKIIDNQINITLSTYEKMVNQLIEMLKNHIN